MPDGHGSLFGGESGGGVDETVYGTIALLSGHGEQARVFWLAVGEGERGLNGGAEGIFVDAIRGSARGAAVRHRSNRNRQAVLRDVLMNAVVGETRQRVGDFVDVDFRFFGSRGFREAQNGIDNAAK